MLLAGRSLQGLGAALMSPAALATVMTLFTGPSRGKALGVWSGLAAPARQQAGTGQRGLDVPGAVLVTAGTAAAIYGLINVGSHGWAATSTVLPLLLAVATWAAFAVIERRVRRPLLTVGLAFLPIAAATVAGAEGGSQALARVNTRIVAVTGLALAAAGYAIAAHWPQPAAMVAGLSIAALGIGATFVTAFATSLTDATPDQAGLRSALVNTFHELGGAAGVAVLSSAAGAGLVAARLASHDFTRAFTVGAVAAAVAVASAAVLVPAGRRNPPSASPTAAASPAAASEE